MEFSEDIFAEEFVFETPDFADNKTEFLSQGEVNLYKLALYKSFVSSLNPTQVSQVVYEQVITKQNVNTVNETISRNLSGEPLKLTNLGNKLVSMFGGSFQQFAARRARDGKGVKKAISRHYGGFAIDWFYPNNTDRLNAIQYLLNNPDISLIIDYKQERTWVKGRGWRSRPGIGGGYRHLHIETTGSAAGAAEYLRRNPFRG
jgi:hypothetical protein